MVRKDYTKPPHHTMISDTRLDQPSVLDQPPVGNFAAFGAPRERSKIPHSMLGLVYWSTSWTDPDARGEEKVGEETTLRLPTLHIVHVHTTHSTHTVRSTHYT